MYPSVKREIPAFIEEYLIFSDCFTDINKQKTCWVLTKNLKFFEFCKKQLVSSIDLRSTCLNKLKKEFEIYKGPKGKWYETSNLERTKTENDNQISIGKYVFHVLNIYKIYVVIHCWEKCVVLKRLPDFRGFEIRAEYEGVLGFRIVHGSIKFCPVIEFKFLNNEILKTDFEDQLLVSDDEQDSVSNKIEIRQLLEQIRGAKTELQLHKSITANSFHSVQNNLTLGQPFLRTYKLEEKQILGRCGDIWKRFTVNDDLVIGVPLVNQCATPNVSIIRNVMPVIQIKQLPEKLIQLQYRLYQLKLKFDQIEDLESFLESEDEQLQNNVWCSNGDLKILPESFVVLLIKLKISQIISLKQCSLILNYDVKRHLDAPEELNPTFIMPLQLFLQNIDFHKLLFEERSQCELKFLPNCLHQDFLTIAMTSQETNLKIKFLNLKDLETFQHFIENSLNFLKPTFKLKTNLNNANFDLLLYNKNPSSLWFGSLILRLKESENDNDQCLTTWRIFCPNSDRTLLLIKTFLNDMLIEHCNIISITNNGNEEKASKCIMEFENALRQELLQLQNFEHNSKITDPSQEYLNQLEKLFQLQLNCDIAAIDALKNKANI